MVKTIFEISEKMIPVIAFTMHSYAGNTLDLAMVIMAQNYFKKVRSLMTSLLLIESQHKNVLYQFGKIDEFL